MTHARIVLTVFMLALWPCYGWAGELSLQGGIGGSFFQPTIMDGTWFNQGLDHTWKRDSLSYKLGLSYAFSPQWAVSLAYLNMGTTGVDARTTLDDNDYDPVHHKCYKRCDSLGHFKVRDRMQGGEITVTRSFPSGNWTPFVKVGAAVMAHNLQVVMIDSANIGIQEFQGNIPMTVLGGGIEYKPWHVALDTSWYHGLGGDDSGCIGGTCGWPISKQVLVTMFTINVPLF